MAFLQLSSKQMDEFQKKGRVKVPGMFEVDEIMLLRQSAKADNALDKHSFGRSDGEGGKVRLALWNHPGEGIYGMFARCRRVVRSMELLLGGKVYHYHSKMIMKDAKVGGASVPSVVDRAWLEGEFLKTVATRGKAIIEARGASSAASAAAAAIDHMATLWNGTAPGEISSMAVCSNGAYGVSEGLIFSFPVTASAGNWSVVEGLELDEFARARIAATTAELLSERETVKDLLA